MSIEALINKVLALKNSKVKRFIDNRIEEFIKLNEESDDEWFKELCFCILTANYSAERGIYIQRMIGDGFLTLDQCALERELRVLGYRYPRRRTEYIISARKYMESLKKIVLSFEDSRLAREWLVKNIKGLGYKESSHFLRNIGFLDLAIIDYHVLDLLFKYQVIRKYRVITRKRYLYIEDILKEIAVKTELKLGELDLYLWYMETGRILK